MPWPVANETVPKRVNALTLVNTDPGATAPNSPNALDPAATDSEVTMFKGVTEYSRDSELRSSIRNWKRIRHALVTVRSAQHIDRIAADRPEINLTAAVGAVAPVKRLSFTWDHEIPITRPNARSN